MRVQTKSEKSDEVLLIWIQKLELSNEEISFENISSHSIIEFFEALNFTFWKEKRLDQVK